MPPAKKPVAPAEHLAPNIAQVRKSHDDARNAKQKSVLLREAARLGKERFWRAADETRKLWDESKAVLSKRRAAKSE